MLFLCIMACGTDNINMGKKTITSHAHAGHFHLIFSWYVGSNFPADFLQKIETFAFQRLLNIFGAVSADNRSLHEWEKIKRK